MRSKKDAVQLRARNYVSFHENQGPRPLKGKETSKILEMIIQKLIDLNGFQAKSRRRTASRDSEPSF